MSIRRSAQSPRALGLGSSVVEPGLSFRAIGLLAYILSQPVARKCSVAELVDFSAGSNRPEGRDSIYATIKELTMAGYIVGRQLRDEDGQMDGFEHEVFSVHQRGSL
ncbi:hypothetical protein [Pseudomonas typographi]|uniref:hypothetical protein n=1 Tax=Pseudomonas typographi TaxID=2715964 RepID=UPI001682871C|nr:hypothetical protein [Pseudomonas typographi]MBD1553605.1 hypothetical protein [Pseudomonas typographi]